MKIVQSFFFYILLPHFQRAIQVLGDLLELEATYGATDADLRILNEQELTPSLSNQVSIEHFFLIS